MSIASSPISPIFAYLPNGIIREIVSYTGATYKKRNGKYIGQKMMRLTKDLAQNVPIRNLLLAGLVIQTQLLI